MIRIAREVLTYGLATGLAFACDFAVLAILVQLAGWNYLVAASLSFLVGATVAYALSVRFVFRHRPIQDRRIEFAGFAAIGTVGLSINAAAMYAGVEWLGLHYLLAKIGSGFVTFLTNYLARKLILFTPRRVNAGPVAASPEQPS